ncbi:hypothetical protein [Spirillospora sp. NPDC047279]|uniref:hypothetical protein n=1 Tax=Spirillospora sp. NPDC047279 TaxID=3155478 RepID=UPI0033D919D1
MRHTTGWRDIEMLASIGFTDTDEIADEVYAQVRREVLAVATLPTDRVRESWREHARREFLMETGALNMWSYNRQMSRRRDLDALQRNLEAA